MSEYEFWDELGNIFNAIVAYQHKTIEFNKRYVNPWLRLGTVFDQNDHNADALLAHKKAIEIDQENGSNWLSLGDVYFKMGSFDDAIGAYSKAIELNPRLGWAYANLAFAYTSRQRYSEAVNCYVKSLELIEDEKDRAMIWNRLGNVYRKVNDYDNAFIAFQMADECDGQNTGFDDQLDEVTVEQRVMPIVAEVYVSDSFRTAEAAPVVADEAPVVESPVVAEPAIATVAEVAEAEVVAVETSAADVPVVEEPAIAEAAVVAELEAAAVETSAADLPVVEEPAIAEAAVVAELEAAAVETSLVEAPLTEEPGIVELAEVAEPEIVVEQVVEPDASVVEVSAPQAVISESVESVVLTDEFAMKQQAEEYSPVEVANTVDTLTNTAEIEELVYEDINTETASPEMIEETVITEPAAEIAADEVVSEEVQAVVETAVEETVVEVVQPEAVAEVAAESVTSETASEQAEAGAVVSAEVSAEEAAQASDETSTVEFVNDNSSADTTVAFVMSEAVETFADPSALNSPVILVIENLAELIKHPVPGDEAETVAVEAENQLEVQIEVADKEAEPVAADVSQPANESLSDEVAEIVAEIVALAGSREEDEAVLEEIQEKVSAVADEVTASIADMESVPSGEADGDAAPVISEEPAYDEFLKDAVELVAASAEETNAVESQVALKSEIKVEPDTKNAHVWNELGNVYFNTGAFEEAIVAYSKAIELDDWFAWPYSNLALVYVQKEKYAEAILLYQRSIELFASDKEKAITWNRLGNVYRRLNDYDNAISCYQRADELDPNNATRSLRSRFSLLGSLNVEQSSTLTV